MSNLRGALSSTLSGILLDLDQEKSSQLLQQQLPQQVPLFSAPAQTLRSPAGLMPSISLPPTYASLLKTSQPSLALGGAPKLSLSPAASAWNPNSLILAAAVANQSQMVQNAKASLLQKQLILEEHKKRILQAKQDEQAMKQQATKPKAPIAKEALQVLGRSLRKAADPYIDAAQLSKMSDETEKGAKKQPRKARGGVTDPFPDKLHRMLSDGDKHSGVVSFLPHGRAFYVHDMDRFVSDVMPLYFKQTKWTSFARQLSLYGFQRIHSGPDAGAYYHELFLRGRPQLVEHMRRVGVPQGQDRRKFRSQQKTNRVEPDFYSMKALE